MAPNLSGSKIAKLQDQIKMYLINWFSKNKIKYIN